MARTLRIFTIGFTQKSAEQFFSQLKDAGVRRLLDIRLNNTSQLAGFSKKEDLAYFVRKILGIDYVHLPALAPTQDILDAFKKSKGTWQDYEASFLALMKSRQVAKNLDRALFADGCLLCSELKPEHCHRRLVAEHLQAKWGNIEIVHL